MIAAVSWVPRGVAKPAPEVIEPPSVEELDNFRRLYEHAPDISADEREEDMVDDDDDNDNEGDVTASKTHSEEVENALNAAHALGCDARKASANNGLDDVATGLAELDMDNYDNEDEGVELFGNGGLGAAYYSRNDLDPYLVDKDSEDEEEIEDMTIKPSDLLILTARNEDDVSHLEVWIYEDMSEDGTHNMYVHHDIMLPAFPLSLAWLDCDLKGGEKGNYVAIGTMQPEIEIWDLDILDAVEPAVTLGGYKQSSFSKVLSEKKKKKKKSAKLKEDSHSDAVLCLAWNHEFRNVLASGSADHSIKIWDVVTQKCEHTLNTHSDKVQAVAWHKEEPTALLSGSFDKTLALTDMRAPAHDGVRWPVSADVESLAWDPHTSHYFVVSLEDGMVSGHDIRKVVPASSGCPAKGGEPLFNIHAHDKAVCTVSYNAAIPHLLATGSIDKTVKLWHLKDNEPGFICSQNFKLGAVFASAFCNDSPFLLALGGSKGKLHVWDIMTEAEVARRFGRYRQSK